VAAALGIAAAVAATAAFAHGFVRLRRRGRADLAGWDRAALFGLAIALWLVALSPPIDELADRLLSAHMLEHVLIGDAAPALVLVAVRGPLLFFLLPAGLLRRLAHASWLRRAGRQLLRPRAALLVWAASLGLWHVPALYDQTLAREWLHGLQHASFVLGGLLVWSVLVDPARRGALSVRLRLGYALAAPATIAHLAAVQPPWSVNAVAIAAGSVLVLRGTAGSPGIVRGPARVLRSLADADKLRTGDVLVAETTAPPWTHLFATAAAVVTDTGGMLSHCAVVAREYGIPAVVGVGRATDLIHDGQIVEVDGHGGVVRLSPRS